ncbi:MAG: carbon-nitrogen hydrolase family protein [Acidimicrobiales bacterium]|nr:carbon-nitrogen hydrolase family protein [Acidimicrobiales bacterium]
MDVPIDAVTVAAGQARCVAGDVETNAITACDMVRRAQHEGAEVLLLPELFLTGYELDGIVHDPSLAIQPDDPRLDELGAACRDAHVAVVVGAPTQGASGALYISALVFGRNGQRTGQYDKQFLDAAERAAGFTAGAGDVAITIDGWRIGLGICWDAAFPEHARTSALDGCHAYAVGGLFSRGDGETKRAIRGAARAVDNSMYVLFSNHVGPQGAYVASGHSTIWDPNGAVRADAGADAPGLAVATLDPEVVRAARCGDNPLAELHRRTDDHA